MASLQNIFTVKLPNAATTSNSQPESSSSFMELPDTTAIMATRSEGGGDQQAPKTLDDYKELASDILTEVLMNMASGKHKTSSSTDFEL